MSKQNLKEAVESVEQLKTRISSLEQAYNNRKAEVDDDEYWKEVPRGAKLAILSKLDSLQRDLDKAKKKLKRLETSEVVVEDELPGGLGDNAQVADFSPEQVSAGLKVEMEHTNDPKIALEIVLDHLTEDSEYYTKLATIENTPEEKDIVTQDAKLNIEQSLIHKQQLENLVQQLENFIVSNNFDNTFGDELKEALSKLKNIVNILDKQSSSLFDQNDNDLDYVINNEESIEEEEQHLLEEVDEVISQPEAIEMTKKILKDIIAGKTPQVDDKASESLYSINVEEDSNDQEVEIMLGFDTKDYGKHFDGWIEIKCTVSYSYSSAPVSGTRDVTPGESNFSLDFLEIESIQFYNDVNSENYFLSLADKELNTLSNQAAKKLIKFNY